MIWSACAGWANIRRVDTVNLCETFLSLQGESARAGLPCFFIRLAGCNLRCAYCDTERAYGPGRPVAVGELVSAAEASGAALVEVTGGEPLLQPAFPALARGLQALPGRTILVETNGSQDLTLIPAGVIAIMDIKCPGSGEAQRMDYRNLARLRPGDEVKFVLSDEADYRWAREMIQRHGLAKTCAAVLLSPAWGRLDPHQLAEWMITDRLPVRLQLPLHKVLGVP